MCMMVCGLFFHGPAGTINTATGTRFTTGGVIRVLRQFPGGYDAWAMAADGSSQLLTTLDKEPSYQVMRTALGFCRLFGQKLRPLKSKSHMCQRPANGAQPMRYSANNPPPISVGKRK